MSMEVQPQFVQERLWLEQILLKIADKFQIRIVWDAEASIITGVFALAGGLLGGYTGGRLGATLGAGIGSAAGFGVSQLVCLRDIWVAVKDKLIEVLYIILNYLRRIDPVDYVRAFEILMACTSSRTELVLTIVDFIAHKLGREVFSSLAAA